MCFFPSRGRGQIGFLLAIVMSYAAVAQAASVVFQFSGKIEDSFSPLVAVGDSFSGHFQYDLNATASLVTDSLADYPLTPPDGVYFTAGQVTGAPAESGTLGLFNDFFFEDNPPDQFDIHNQNFTAQIHLTATTGAALDSLDPPASLDLAAFDQVRRFIGRDAEGNAFQGEVLSLSPGGGGQPVIPLPPALWSGMLCAGMMGIGWIRQRRRTLAAGR